jgi:hypothetical protein
LVSVGPQLPRDGRDWIHETTLCPDQLDNSTHGGGDRDVVNRSTGIHGPPPVDFYGGVPFEVPGTTPGTLLMTVNRYWHVRGSCVSKSCQFGAPGRHTVGLAVSRTDGLSWSWVGDRATLISNGEEGSWNSRAIWAMGPPIWLDSGDLFLYFGGHNKAEGNFGMPTTINGVSGLDPSAPGGEEQAGYGLAVSRHDGWASIGSGYATVGELTTVPLLFDGTSLIVNVVCGGHGTLQAEVQDETGRPLSCFTLERSVATWATSIREKLQWDQRGVDETEECSLAAVGQRAGGARLRFVIEDCRLHAFAFSD